MTAASDAIASLEASGLRHVLIWAAPAAFTATDQLFDEDQGHDQGVIGYLNFKHLTDNIDRATSNGRFALGPDVTSRGDDFLKRGITPAAFRAMPSIPAGAITRSNYKQSPGWAADGYRVLLQSYPFGKVDEIKWVQRSDAKREIAAQLYIGDSTLFDDADYGLESVEGIPDDDTFVGITLIAAHSFDPTTKQFELYIGQSKNPEYPRDTCWHWKVSLLASNEPNGTVELPVAPVTPTGGASTDVEDIPVRIRKPRTDEGAGSANG